MTALSFSFCVGVVPFRVVIDETDERCRDADLPKAFFIQYKPAEFNWPDPEEFVVTEVERDRGWFETNLPIMRAFWDKVLYHREHGIEEPPKKEVKRRPRKEQPCEIEEDSQDEYFSDT